MKRIPLRLAVAAAAVVALGIWTAPQQASAAFDPCSNQPVYDWMGSSDGQDITIPSLTSPNAITSYDGFIFRPTDTVAYPGPRPVVVLQHGLGGSKCGLYWLARLLAGHGYVTLTWTSPKQGNDDAGSFINGLDATRSAIAFAKAPANPFSATSDGSRIGVGGHSMGSIIASYVQQDPDSSVRAIVALDNLRRWVKGDPGAAAQDCLGGQGGEITPRVPALGFAKDETCAALPDVNPPELKEAGFEQWRAYGVPSMELVMRGFVHGDFAQGGDERKHKLISHYVLAWFQRWISDDPSALNDLLATEVEGEQTASILSTQFRSGAYLPPMVDTSDYVSWLERDQIAPVTRMLKQGPDDQIRQRAVRKRGLTFRFEADEAATYECRLDGGKWHKCSSPRKYERIKDGKHSFRVRATDLAGNRELEPVRWKFRVVS